MGSHHTIARRFSPSLKWNEGNLCVDKIKFSAESSLQVKSMISETLVEPVLVL